MNKKILRIITILLMTIVLTVSFSGIAFSALPSAGDFDQYGDSTGASTSAQNVVGYLIDVFQVVGVGVAIIMLIMLAIKYLTAAPNEKAEIKKSVSIYVLGAVLLFAASGVLEIIQQFSKNIQASGGANGGGDDSTRL